MKKLKFTKETLGLSLVLILSAILNFANISIEAYGNGYYAAGVKSMTMSLKNFFFVSFDPTGFVTIDKPPLGFWIQAIFAKIFGFSGWSILLPEALAGVISVWLIYYLVKRSFGTVAGLISALCLAVTPVFVAASRNNTIDNLLVVTLLSACVALSIAAEKGKVKYLIISLVLVGIGFNIKMLEAYMIGPAFYITYLLSSTISFKKKIKHLVLGTVVLFAVSLSWAAIVDLVPAQNRPYVGSSTNNSVLELIIGHNGLERLGLGNKSDKGARGLGNDNQGDGQRQSQNTIDDITQNAPNSNNQGQQMPQGSPSENGQGGGNMQPPNGGGQGGPGGGNQGSFGGQTPAGVTRLFSKNSLSDQIIWFLPLALLGFIAGAIKEKLRFKLDNKRKLSLSLWFIWLVPEFVYFSFTTGLFHPYYLTMMAPPAAALAGIGISTMWQFYKEGGWKAWLLPIAFVVEGLTHMLMLSYYYSMPNIMRNIIIAALILCFVSSVILGILNILSAIKSKKSTFENNDGLKEIKDIKLKKTLVGIALIGILVTPFIGASAAITHKVNETIPCAGLELLSNTQKDDFGGGNMTNTSSGNTKLIEFLKSNKTNEKYLLAVSSARSSQDMIIQTGESVMAIGGFSGSDNILTLDQFKELVKKGEVRYVLTGGMGGGANSEIMNWATQNGKAVPESEWKDTTTSNNQPQDDKQNTANLQNQNSDKSSNRNSGSRGQNFGGEEGRNSEQLYDLKDAADTLK
ncbi:glycosyltransferase family 39 protein [Clostridium uliginosum]|uniref:Dolichyl-phosphate-mannose-protein mannosyltransferase n=1 Tax=Clostridium uliginosum TaxID=119641 RepID=A0A1I1JT44_9CLOT|nr:glycosyltransferase family 39 protein [Clostridium uliginosum]SFC51535.1 Dolichyl-phosphate-mannose-protein mannosyltransferase [Clostridium uliginosum]